MDKDAKIYVAGHSGMVGSAIMRRLTVEGYRKVITKDHAELDLLDQREVEVFFSSERPEVTFLAAAKVGGIMANMTNQAAFLYENLQIQNNVINSSIKHGVKFLVFFSSSCVYPRLCPQPMKEEYLLTGPLEPTNEGYALAKIAGMKLLQYHEKSQKFRYLSVIPCNLYGVNDDFDLDRGHVMASLVRRFVDAADRDAKEIELWGTGFVYRELMHVDDMVDAVFFVIERYNCNGCINIGTGSDIQIKDLAELIAVAAGFGGKIIWNKDKPDGMPRKCLDVSHLKGLGWEHAITLEEGIDCMIKEYKNKKNYGWNR
jgi:GDP-L-fucose synthase